MSMTKMTRVEDTERQVQEFSTQELAAFRNWFLAFDAEAWDRQIEADVRAGKLDSLGRQSPRGSGRWSLLGTLKHLASPTFWAAYRSLPRTIQQRADGAFALLKDDPRHASLHLKKVGRFWSARIGRSHRALAVDSPRGLLWFWIGTHAEYDRLIG